MSKDEHQLAKKLLVSAGFLLLVFNIVPAAYQAAFGFAVNAFWLWDI